MSDGCDIVELLRAARTGPLLYGGNPTVTGVVENNRMCHGMYLLRCIARVGHGERY